MHARRRFSYANVMSTIAVFLALGGGAAFAAQKLAKNSVGAKQIKKGAVTPKKLSKSTKRYIARTGKGKTGAQGVQGIQGLAGKDGATGSALLTGHATTVPSAGPGSSQFRRATPSGLSAVTSGSTEVASLSPNRALEIRDVAVRIPTDLPNTARVDWELYVGQNVAESAPLIACSINGTAGTSDTSCTAAGPVTLPPASLMWVRIVTAGGSATANPGEVDWGMSLQPVS
jgi:hypothetical protein